MLRFLVLSPGTSGEQLWLFPTLYSLSQVPAQVDVVVAPAVMSLYKLCPWVTRVLRYEYDSRNSLTEWVNLLGAVRDGYYDGVVVTRPSGNLSFLLWLSGVRERVGFAGAGQRWLTQVVTPKPQQYPPEFYHDLVAGLGLRVPCGAMAVQIPAAAVAWAETQQQQLGLQSGYALVVWDDQYPHWAQVVAQLQQQQPDLPLVALGDRAAIATLTPADEGQQAALLAGATLVVVSEAQPTLLQLAVAVQAPVVALLSAATPQRVLPTSELCIPLCAPTLAEITPAQVVQALG
ncbi:Glycosyl transferase, family 9 [Gloeomargarita lithophora Alchichica-D10]|uniref:Glycosyl transferase, family 9 n=1 Tax=Gloeomargarita lithophora Alchichica-D10 TaxID=1188229 RepID=A0A1J0ACJ4_9CYAN|nr:glycosyltransferase family 9 protein [Gloeomargarita lithophora]APB33653.1 Glycosyl transferase, family 9 [Gloeomargarita lithophora Alchichica-D10]